MLSYRSLSDFLKFIVYGLYSSATISGITKNTYPCIWYHKFNEKTTLNGENVPEAEPVDIGMPVKPTFLLRFDVEKRSNSLITGFAVINHLLGIAQEQYPAF